MEQYVKRFQRFHAGEDVRPVTSCKFLHCYEKRINFWPSIKRKKKINI